MELHFSRGSRAKGVAIVVLVLMALFIVRLFYIQIVQHGYFVDQANSEHIKQFTLHAKRGEIYVMDGSKPTKLVLNETVYTVWADPTQVVDKSAVISELNKVAGGNVRDNFAQYLDVENSRYQVLATKVTRTQAELLKKARLAGIGFDAVTQRVYPEGQLGSQILGFVNGEGKGVYGFEQANNKELSGKDGLLKTVTDIRDVPLTVSDKNIRVPAVNGKNMVLTIDRNIQAQTEQALADGVKRSGANKASAIVIDPRSGKVLAMANVPTYDPSQINKVTDVAAFNNNTISQPYEPGSDIKTFTVATGIDKGVIARDSKYNNTGSIKVDDITIKNASQYGFLLGNITMQTALNWSLNTGMVTIAERLGDGQYITRGARDIMYDYFHNHFRLGRTTGIELANEAPGILVSPKEVQGNAVRYSNMAFGQGMDATMIQVASGFGAVVNGGTYYTPTVIAGEVTDGGDFKQSPQGTSYPNVIAESTSTTLRKMVHEAHYATYKPQNEPKGFYTGGKTGTSQTLINGEYVDNQTIGTYLGFGGEKNAIPSYVIMVEISGKGKNMGGGSDAKPIFNQISNWLLGYLKLTPKG